MNTHFLCFISRRRACCFLCRDVLRSNALPCLCNIMLCQRRFRDVNAARKTIMNHNFLRSVFCPSNKYLFCRIRYQHSIFLSRYAYTGSRRCTLSSLCLKLMIMRFYAIIGRRYSRIPFFRCGTGCCLRLKRCVNDKKRKYVKGLQYNAEANMPGCKKHRHFYIL